MFFNWYREARGVGKAIYPTRAFGCTIAALYIFFFPSPNESTLLFRYFTSLFLLVYPHLSFWYYIKSNYSSRVELNYFLIDLFLIGVTAGFLHFALVPSMVFLVVVLSTTVGLGDHKHLSTSILCLIFGALFSGMIEGFRYEPNAPFMVEVISLFFLLFGMTSRNYFSNKRTLEFLAAKQEIRAQKEKIEASLQEKEILLREVHHRVKNNLQLVYSLLNLQQKGLTDKKAVHSVVASKQRIKVISLVHESLYKTDEAREVDISVYLDEILGYVKNLNLTEMGEVQIQSKIEPVFIDLTKAVPLGLILNEIISNSFKHAFDADNKGKVIALDISGQDETLRLCVSDNGKGLEDIMAYLSSDAQSMGIALIHDLVRQLKGEIKINSEEGVSYVITLPLQSDY